MTKKERIDRGRERERDERERAERDRVESRERGCIQSML